VAANIIPPKREILSIVLGASNFEGLPRVQSDRVSAAFMQSKLDFAQYVAGISSRFLDKFDCSDLPNKQCIEIGQFLRSAASATDLIVYYVGHGGFLSDAATNREYFLALRGTTEADTYATGLKVSDLERAIRNAKRLRTIIILDCCYAGEAVKYFIGGDLATKPSFETRFGLTIFAASASQQEAVAPLGEKRTMFSGCLLDVLSNGISDKEPVLSIKEIADRVRLLIKQRYTADVVRPEIHSPRQSDGDVADYPLFPNAAYSAVPRAGGADAVTETPLAKPSQRQEASLGLYFADAAFDSPSGIAALACVIIENPQSVRSAIENTRRLLINSRVLDLSAEVRERLQKIGFDYSRDDSDVSGKLIETIARLTYEAYTCVADIAYFKEISEELIFCELFGKLLLDRISKHKSERIEIFLRSEREGLREFIEGVASSCVHAINSRGRGRVLHAPIIHMLTPRNGCIELAQYIAAIVSRRLDQRATESDGRNFRRIESKVRLIQRLDTGQRFSRRHPLPD